MPRRRPIVSVNQMPACARLAPRWRGVTTPMPPYSDSLSRSNSHVKTPANSSPRSVQQTGVFTCEFDRDRLSVYGGIGVVTPRHRGANLAQAGIWFTETIGRRLGMGLAYGMATLKAPHAQRAFERAGWLFGRHDARL